MGLFQPSRRPFTARTLADHVGACDLRLVKCRHCSANKTCVQLAVFCTEPPVIACRAGLVVWPGTRLCAHRKRCVDPTAATWQASLTGHGIAVLGGPACGSPRGAVGECRRIGFHHPKRRLAWSRRVSHNFALHAPFIVCSWQRRDFFITKFVAMLSTWLASLSWGQYRLFYVEHIFHLVYQVYIVPRTGRLTTRERTT